MLYSPSKNNWTVLVSVCTLCDCIFCTVFCILVDISSICPFPLG